MWAGSFRWGVLVWGIADLQVRQILVAAYFSLCLQSVCWAVCSHILKDGLSCVNAPPFIPSVMFWHGTCEKYFRGLAQTDSDTIQSVFVVATTATEDSRTAESTHSVTIFLTVKSCFCDFEHTLWLCAKHGIVSYVTKEGHMQHNILDGWMDKWINGWFCPKFWVDRVFFQLVCKMLFVPLTQSPPFMLPLYTCCTSIACPDTVHNMYLCKCTACSCLAVCVPLSTA